MQKSYYMIEQLDDSATPGMVELKVCAESDKVVCGVNIDTSYFLRE